MGTPHAAGPLAGIRVLGLTRALSGPFATMILGDLGADVIKVEDVWHGDDTRRWGPPFQGDDAACFLSVNRNKRGLSVNMKEPRGRDLVRRLAAASDVMIENFRPGTAARLGLGYDELARQNPRLIYASISGYGQAGPSASLPGYDAVAQAVSGMMSVTGEPDGEPVRSGTSLADTGAGMWAVIGILAALHAREASGLGQLVDVSLLDGQVAWRFAEAIGRAELAGDPRFATNPDRVRNRDTLIPLITEALELRDAGVVR